MQKLQLPEYEFRVKNVDKKWLIFDEFRRKWVAKTPEEWVRQHFLKYLVREKQFPISLIAVEKKVIINGLPQRFDLLVYDRKGQPLLMGEFKAPDIAVDQAVFDQVIRYNSTLKVPYVLVSNGINHFVCSIDYKNHTTVYLNAVPFFKDINDQ